MTIGLFYQQNLMFFSFQGRWQRRQGVAVCQQELEPAGGGGRVGEGEQTQPPQAVQDGVYPGQLTFYIFETNLQLSN